VVMSVWSCVSVWVPGCECECAVYGCVWYGLYKR